MPARSRNRFNFLLRNASGLEYGSVAIAPPGFLHVIARFYRSGYPCHLPRSRYRWPAKLDSEPRCQMPKDESPMPAEPAAVDQPKPPILALTTYELKDYRRELERAIKGISADAPVQDD